MANNFKRLCEQAKQLTELTGIKHRFQGCNGEYFCTEFTPFSYLISSHSIKDMCNYMDALIAGVRYGKNNAG